MNSVDASTAPPIRAVLRKPAVAVTGAVIYGGAVAALLAYWFGPASEWLAGFVGSPAIPLSAVGWAAGVALYRRRLGRTGAV